MARRRGSFFPGGRVRRQGQRNGWRSPVLPASRRATAALAAWLLLAAGLAGGCAAGDGERPASGGGDAERGRAAIERYHCGTCHQVPGIPGSNGRVGPTLAGLADRQALAGGVANTPENLARWIRNPQAVKPGTIMPDLAIGDRDARDIVAYLLAAPR